MVKGRRKGTNNNKDASANEKRKGSVRVEEFPEQPVQEKGKISQSLIESGGLATEETVIGMNL